MSPAQTSKPLSQTSVSVPIPDLCVPILDSMPLSQTRPQRSQHPYPVPQYSTCPHPSVPSSPVPYSSVPSAPHPCGRLPISPCARTGARCAVGAPSAGTRKCKPVAARTPGARPGSKLRGGRGGVSDLSGPLPNPLQEDPHMPCEQPISVPMRGCRLPRIPLKGDADFPVHPLKALRTPSIPPPK